MAKTKFIEFLNTNSNLDTDLNDGPYNQEANIKKIVLLDGENGSSMFVKDDVEITYFREVKNAERSTYTDDDDRTGYKYVFEFEREEFAGEIKTVCLANKNFIDPRFSNTYSQSTDNTFEGSGTSYSFTADDMINQYTKVLDFDFESGTLLTLNIRYIDDEWTAVFCKWNHNFRNFRIGGAQSYFYLDEVISIDIDDLMKIPDGQGGWTAAPANTTGAIFFGVDDQNDNYVITYMTKNAKVFNNLVISKNDLTQTNTYKMILPNEVSYPSNTDFYGYWTDGNYKPKYSLMYKGRFCMPLYATRTEHEQEISGVYMCSINYMNSTDIKALETHCINSSGQDVAWSTNMPNEISLPLINAGCVTAISSAWTIKNDIAYLKQGGTKNWGFYYDGFMLETVIGNGTITFKWHTCPYCLSIYETLVRPFFKTLNKTLKYTFRVVNSGGTFYYE